MPLWRKKKASRREGAGVKKTKKYIHTHNTAGGAPHLLFSSDADLAAPYALVEVGQDLSHLLVVLPAFSLVLREKRGREGKDRATGERCGNEEGEGVRGNHKKHGIGK